MEKTITISENNFKEKMLNASNNFVKEISDNNPNDKSEDFLLFLTCTTFGSFLYKELFGGESQSEEK